MNGRTKGNQSHDIDCAAITGTMIIDPVRHLRRGLERLPQLPALVLYAADALIDRP